VAADAVAVGADKSKAVTLGRCEDVVGDKDCADVAVLPRGGAVYLSGVPESGGLTKSAVNRSMSSLLVTLQQLELSQAHIVQLKVFLTPASSADEVLRELKKLFPGQLTPPVAFVEWIASVPVEIELIAQLPPKDQPADPVEYYNPPEVIPSPVFSRAALVRTDRQIFTSSLWARSDGEYEARGRDVFTQLQEILAETGSDLRHLVKATYYVSDDETSGVLNTLRPELFDPVRPPAASKATVHGVGKADRTLTMDMIAVGAP
jgi:enamine deaminase RidA (YjgF/YER057c/UK114 family)